MATAAEYPELVALIREICARELNERASFPFFNANAIPGESPDDTILRVYIEERGSHPPTCTVTEIVLVLCHG